MAQDFRETKGRNPPASNWAMESGYDESTNIEPYPYRVPGTGKHSSLFIILRLHTLDVNYLCSGAVHGFKVTFQAPNEQPKLWKSFYYISPNRAVIFNISPKLTLALPSVFGYSSDVRQCFFTAERRLRFFKGIYRFCFGGLNKQSTMIL